MGCAIRALLLALLTAVLAPGVQAAVLTITPDKSTYGVGETITLRVDGSAEGVSSSGSYGRLLFDGALATHVSSTQTQVTSFDGGYLWYMGALFGGDGFADAFNNASGGTPHVPDDPVVTSLVVLAATQPGVLNYEWQTTGSLETRFRFFGLSNAPGGSITIIPEPGTAPLLLLGLFGLARAGRVPWQHTITRARPSGGERERSTRTPTAASPALQPSSRSRDGRSAQRGEAERSKRASPVSGGWRPGCACAGAGTSG